MNSPYDHAETAARQLTERFGAFDSVVVLGSGLSDSVFQIGTVETQCALGDIHGAPTPTVGGHGQCAYRITTSRNNSEGVSTSSSALVLSGRTHLYEGHHPNTVVHLIRSAIVAGASKVILTNASGGIREDFAVGDPIIIADHLNLTGENPLCGPPPTGPYGSRFCDLSDVYSHDFARRVAPEFKRGVYCGVRGGSYETPAEIHMYSTLGADLIGMSTVLEAIAAKHLGATVLGLALITNKAAGLGDSLDHHDVVANGRAHQDEVIAAIKQAIVEPA